MVPLKQVIRSLERRCLRPIGRGLKRLGYRLPFLPGSRTARLERRVEALESLVRELAGLQYLRLAEAAGDDDPAAA
ncbi:MAG: hypothetical protein EBR23_04990 [Planctomycetia bacterium]|nr:hypothetical protein [Planctomycetia bacterium]